MASLRVKWQSLAIVGLGLQVIPVPGRALSLGLLYVSFALLLAFALANVRAGVAGSWLILIGIALNFTVIGLNQGMPVTRDALVASGQGETLAVLLDDGGAKHHVAGPSDRLRCGGGTDARARRSASRRWRRRRGRARRHGSRAD